MRTLALVPARGGSKGIPHKNTREFKGLPLLAHAIKVGQATCDQTVVSTDDAETACLAASYGATVLMRPGVLARDDTPMLPVIQHALANVVDKPDVVVLLQPSSPSARREDYVRAALEAVRENASAVVSVVPIPERYSPDYAVNLVSGRWIEPATKITRRQEARQAYYRDGTVYAIQRWVIEEGGLYGPQCWPLIIPEHDSATIDTEADWALAEARHG